MFQFLVVKEDQENKSNSSSSSSNTSIPMELGPLIIDSHEAMNNRDIPTKTREKRSYEFLIGLINNNSRYEVTKVDPSIAKGKGEVSYTRVLLEFFIFPIYRSLVLSSRSNDFYSEYYKSAIGFQRYIMGLFIGWWLLRIVYVCVQIFALQYSRDDNRVVFIMLIQYSYVVQKRISLDIIENFQFC